MFFKCVILSVNWLTKSLIFVDYTKIVSLEQMKFKMIKNDFQFCVYHKIS